MECRFQICRHFPVSFLSLQQTQLQKIPWLEHMTESHRLSLTMAIYSTLFLKPAKEVVTLSLRDCVWTNGMGHSIFKASPAQIWKLHPPVLKIWLTSGLCQHHGRCWTPSFFPHFLHFLEFCGAGNPRRVAPYPLEGTARPPRGGSSCCRSRSLSSPATDAPENQIREPICVFLQD